MKLVWKYIKPFLPLAILSVLLLFGQNIMELWLPTFMSEIVDTGIVNGGIDEPTPLALTQEAMDAITSFMTENNAV